MKKQIRVICVICVLISGLLIAQNYTIEPTEMDFGTVNFGQNATQTLWFNSVGNGNVEITDITTSNDIELSMTSFTLWNGASIPVDITFTPTEEGTFVDSLVIYSDDPEIGEFACHLTAVVTATPTISVTPTQLDYEIHLNETEEQTQTLTIENTGSDTLNFEIVSEFEILTQTPWFQQNYSDTGFNNLVSTGFVDMINYNYGYESPPGCPGDYFSIKYSGQIYCDESTTYYFESNCCDDAENIYIDGILAFNLTSNGDTDSYYLTEGLHDVEVRFIENIGAACVTLLWSKTSDNYAPVRCGFFETINYSWLTFNQTGFTLESEEIISVSVTANGIGLDYGYYEATIQVASNDPENPIVDVPVSLSVFYPIALLDETQIEFGEIVFNTITNYNFEIINTGNDVLEISSIIGSGNTNLDVQPDTLNIASQDTGHVVINFSPDPMETTIIDTLFLTTNEFPASTIQIPITAVVVPSFEPIITSITDIPDDQGSWVRVNFTRSYYDSDSLRTVQGYSVQIQNDESWETYTSSYAYGESNYTIVVHTPTDSSDVSNGLLNFRVIASMDEGNWASDVVQGYSVDNIVPSAPVGLLYEFGALVWAPCPDEDFQYFAVYYGENIGEYDEEPIATTVDTCLVDISQLGYYVVTAFDYAGNESDMSEEINIVLLGINNIGLPTEYALSPAYPNPFNPTSTIRYQCPEASVVNLAIYNVNGQLVEELVNTQISAGYHEVTWNANNQSTGLYFIKMTTGNYIATQKVVLVK